MDNSLEKFFRNLVSANPPDGLFDKIMARIQLERRVSLRWRLALFCFVMISSVVAIIPAVKMIGADIAQSGLIPLLSLMFSDFTMVVSLWKDFLISIAEVFPFTGVAVFFAASFVFFGSTKYLARDISYIISHRHAITN
jgi:hypothetical protein